MFPTLLGDEMLRTLYGPRSLRRSPVARLGRAGAALSLAVAVATCGVDSTTAVELILAFAGGPGNATAGQSLGTIRVEAREMSGSVSSGFSGSVTIALTPGTGTSGATLSGTLTVDAVNGVATFGNLSIDRSGSGYTLTATNVEVGSAVSTPFDIAPGSLNQLAFTVQPSQSVAGAAIAPAVQVTARDALGNTVTGFTGAVTMQIGTNPAGGTLSGTTTVAAANGVALFSDLSIDRSASGYTLTASTAGPPAAAGNSSAFAVIAAAAADLVFTTEPASTTAGAPMAFAVTARDAFGNTATSFTGNVTLAIGNNPGGATLSGATTMPAVAGVANFSVSLDRMGSGYTFTASASGLTGATSAAFDIAPGAASQLAFTAQPGTATAGSSLGTVTVEARDAVGNLVASFSGMISLAIGDNPGAGTLSGTASMTAVAGVASFTGLSIEKSGAGYTLVASSAGLTAGTSAAFDIVAGAATQLGFAVDPSTATASTAIAPAVVVEGRDAFGNRDLTFTGMVSLAIGNNPGGGTLAGGAAVAAVSGAATFAALSIDKAGTGYTLTAASGGLNGTSAAFDILAGAATQLVFTVQPANAGSGGVLTPAVEVTALDAGGNTATSFTGTVTIAIGANPGGGVLSGTTDMAASAGVASFATLSIDKAGSGYTLDATATGITGATSAAFDIGPAVASHLVFSMEPSSATAGVAIAPAVQVTARDPAGNTATNFTGDVTIAIGANPGSGTLSGTMTVAAVGGIADFSNLSIDRSGVGYTLTASATSLAGATSAGFDIAPAAASQLVFTGQPSNATAGVTIAPPIQITARDPFGNVATGFTGGVTVAITPGTGTAGAVLAGTPTVAAVGGVANFGALNINRSGLGYTLNATAAGVTGATSASFDIIAGAATQLAFLDQPTATTAGQTIAPAVRVAAQDALGNTDLTYAGDVSLAITAGTGTAGAVLSGAAPVTAASGVATFANLSIDKTGTAYSLTATSGSLTASTSAGFDVAPAVATTLVFTVEPGDATAGAAIAPAVEVTVRDGLGNVATNYVGNVTVAITAGTGTAGAVLSGTQTVAVAAGVASFSGLSVDKAGAGYTLTATSGTLTAGTSATFDIAPGAATRLAFTVSPVTTTAGQAMTPAIQVAAQDAFGNTDPTFSGNVTVALGANPGGGTLTGSTVVPAASGVATFTNLSIDKSGVGYTLGATAGALTGGSSAPFDIVAAAATQLVFTVQPGNTVAGAAMAPAVQVTARDAFGNVATAFVDNVTVAIGNNPGAGTLGGTTTVGAAAGVATFSTLNIDKSGTGYTLTASSSTLNATSAAFNIVAGAVTQVGFVVQPVNTTAGQSIAPAVQVAAQDALGNTNTSFAGNITVAIGTNPSTGVLSGTATVAAVSGVATFANLSIDKSGVGYTLAATSGALTGGTSAAFSIVAGPATKLAFSVQPGPATAGVAMSPAVVVAAQDALGNTATTYTANVTVAIGNNPGAGVLSGATTVAASAGVATFSNLSINRTGTGYTLTATSGALTGATSAAFDVAPGAAAALFFTVQPTNATVNATISPAVQVTARDAFGNVATQFVSNVTMAIGTNPGGGTLSGGVNRAAINGVATFTNLSITAAGAGYTLTASSAPLTPAASTPFNIDPPVAVTLFFTVNPGATQAGVAIAPAVQVAARDASGALVSSFVDPVTVAITSGTGAAGAVLAGTTTQNAVGGVASFPDLSIDKTGSYKLTATSGALTGFSAFFSITPGAAADIVYSVPPSNALAGTAITPQIQVTARDALGNVVTGYAGPVTLAITAGTGTGGAVLSNGGPVAPVNGVASFPTASIDLAGAGYTLDASGPGVATATSVTFDITAGAGNHLAFTVQPSTQVAGSTISPAVEITMLDGSNAVDATFTGPVTVAIQAGTGGSGAVLSGTTTVNAVAGVATFNDLSIDKSGLNYRLSATASGAAGAQSGQFNITAGPAARLDFLTQPVTTTAGQVMPVFTVRALDAFGNVDGTFAGNVTLSISNNPGGGTLSGTATVAAVGGTATFNDISIDKSGTGYRFDASSGALTPDVSNAFSILGGAPVRFAFTVQPTSATAGANITPIVRVAGFDALDNIATFTDAITLAITSGTGTPGAVLTNGGPVAPVSGVASFPGLSINLAGSGYTLTASSSTLPGVPPVVSTAFNIN
jgi:hypothetical protein